MRVLVSDQTLPPKGAAAVKCDSLQGPASAVPLVHADPSLQVSLPSDLQEQSPPPRYTRPDEMSLSVMESTEVLFSSGFAVEKITTGFESRWFVIEDVPITVDRTAIERLVAPFGEAQDIRFRDERRGDASRAVNVRMATYHEAVRAVNGLDGNDAFDHCISAQLSMSKRITKRMFRDSVEVRWPVPCKAGYAGYSTLEAAQSAVSKADGTTERGHWITASMYQSIPFIDDYNVRFTGLPPEVDQKFLEKFGPSGDTMLERPNYQAREFGIPAIRNTLASFGKITRFKVAPPPYKNGFVRVWCQFESPDVARAACELHRVKQRALSMEKISVFRVLSFLERIPRAKFDLVERDLLHLQEKVFDHSRDAHLDILPPGEGEAAVRLEAKDSKTLARLRVELKEIVDGEIVKENGQQVWDDFLRCKAGVHFLEEMRGSNPDVMISVHSFRRFIRLIGSVERRQSVAAAILAKLFSRRQDKVHIIPLDGQMMGVVASPELAEVQQRHGEENIRIDFQGHALLVRGPDDLYEEVQRVVHTVKSRHVGDFGDDYCPVCLEPPLTPVSLSCGQRWCKACLVSYLTAAAETRSFPISCLGNQGRCTEFIPMWMAHKVLPPADFDALASAAFHAYVQAHPGEYHYCPTPDCPQAYPTGPRNLPLSCPSCLARICSSCHVEYHEGVDCADREDGGDRLFQEWMRVHDVKKCPGCHAPIEHAAGCNHMTCSRCHTHTCWVCLETFPEGQGIYDHMREYHGGIGL
jgi:IBR (half RING finger) domain-containing protein